jgi:predicted metalloendopeptidase
VTPVDPDPTPSKKNYAYDQELMHAKFAEIDKVASFDDLAKLMAKLTREGYGHLFEFDALVMVKKSEINFSTLLMDINREETNLKTFGFTQQENDDIYRLSKMFVDALTDVNYSSAQSESSEAAKSLRSIGRDDRYWNNPDHLRVNGNVVMLDDWYTLFGVRPTDKSYLKPEDRIIIW